MISNKLYVGNLLYEVTDQDLRDFFEQIGSVESAEVVRFSRSQRSKGYGFVVFADEESVQKAIDQFNGTEFRGRKLMLGPARAKKMDKKEQGQSRDQVDEQPKDRAQNTRSLDNRESIETGESSKSFTKMTATPLVQDEVYSHEPPQHERAQQEQPQQDQQDAGQSQQDQQDAEQPQQNEKQPEEKKSFFGTIFQNAGRRDE